jgi:hypothetical protein
MTTHSSHSEMETLTAQVGKWGMEAGFFDLEDHLEPRLAALIRDSSEKLFGNCEAELDCLQSALDSAEIEWSAASRVVERPRPGLFRRLCFWLRNAREYRAACGACRRLEPELRKLRLDLDAARSARNAAAEWRKHASETLPANYQFQKNRAALARPAKETSHDTRETRNLIVQRAN